MVINSRFAPRGLRLGKAGRPPKQPGTVPKAKEFQGAKAVKTPLAPPRTELEARLTKAHEVISILLAPDISPKKVLALGGDGGFRMLVKQVYPSGVEEHATPQELKLLELASRVVIAAKHDDGPSMLNERAQAQTLLREPTTARPTVKKAAVQQSAHDKAFYAKAMDILGRVDELGAHVDALRAEYDRNRYGVSSKNHLKDQRNGAFREKLGRAIFVRFNALRREANAFANSRPSPSGVWYELGLAPRESQAFSRIQEQKYYFQREWPEMFRHGKWS